ncbi:lanthionine synthetase C family protein [Rugosimonospora africana]|nr:lanthionine synthetase C family protein [Rugosimonospora africana]
MKVSRGPLTDPNVRWTTAAAQAYLAAEPGAGRPAARVAPPGRPGSGEETDRLLADGIEHLRRGMSPQEPYLWRSDRATVHHDPCDAWRGAAGVLATLTRAARHRPSTIDNTALDLVKQAAAWVDARLYEVSRILPGLSFGRAGTAIALYDAAVLLGDSRLAARAVALAHCLPVCGPNADVTNGVSGAGLARIRLWQATDDPVLRDDALAGAEAVLAAADRDGDEWRWSIPSTTGATSGTHSSYGFGHGLAGIATFLLHAAEVADRTAAAKGATPRRDDLSGLSARLWRAARGAGETLLRAARPDRGGLFWPATPDGDDRIDGLHWCNGSAGAGMFLIRLAAATGDDRFASAARRCAPAAHSLWTSPPGACCGLAGAGQLLLDLADVTGESRWRADAARIGEVIADQAVAVDGLRISAEPDNGYAYGAGTAGVLDFLLRLRHGGPGPWLPNLRTAPAAAVADPSVSMGAGSLVNGPDRTVPIGQS